MKNRELNRSKRLSRRMRLASAMLAGATSTGVSFADACSNVACYAVAGGDLNCVYIDSSNTSCVVGLGSCTVTLCPPVSSPAAMRRDLTPFGKDGFGIVDRELKALLVHCSTGTTSIQANVAKQFPEHGYNLGVLSQDIGGPLQLVSGTFGRDELFQSGIMVNKSNQDITAYRIGWKLTFADGKTSVIPGEWLAVPAGIKPGEVYKALGQGVMSKTLPKGTKDVAFFVLETKASNGQHWRVDRSLLRGSSVQKKSVPVEPLHPQTVGL